MYFSLSPKASHNRYELYIAWWNRTLDKHVYQILFNGRIKARNKQITEQAKYKHQNGRRYYNRKLEEKKEKKKKTFLHQAYLLSSYIF